MRMQRFVARRHAGHEHGDQVGYGARLPESMKAPRPSDAGSKLAAGPVVHEAQPGMAIIEHRFEPDELTTVEQGCAAGGIVYFDAPSGAGGDMLVASLVDLGVPWSVITRAIDALGADGVKLELRRGNSGALSGLRFVVDIDPPACAELAASERSYRQIRELIARSPLDCGIAQRALRVFERLARAESRAHHVPPDEVHFHEVGALDSLVDIVGACAALDYLGGAVWCSPLPLGRGFVSCRHGVIPLPSPAAVECLIGLRTYDAGIDKELVTPTAAAVLGALAEGSSDWPSGVLKAVGWGRGSMNLPDRPNLLRAVVLCPAGLDRRATVPVVP